MKDDLFNEVYKKYKLHEAPFEDNPVVVGVKHAMGKPATLGDRQAIKNYQKNKTVTDQPAVTPNYMDQVDEADVVNKEPSLNLPFPVKTIKPIFSYQELESTGFVGLDKYWNNDKNRAKETLESLLVNHPMYYVHTMDDRKWLVSPKLGYALDNRRSEIKYDKWFQMFNDLAGKPHDRLVNEEDELDVLDREPSQEEISRVLYYNLPPERASHVIHTIKYRDGTPGPDVYIKVLKDEDAYFVAGRDIGFGPYRGLKIGKIEQVNQKPIEEKRKRTKRKGRSIAGVPYYGYGWGGGAVGVDSGGGDGGGEATGAVILSDSEKREIKTGLYITWSNIGGDIGGENALYTQQSEVFDSIREHFRTNSDIPDKALVDKFYELSKTMQDKLIKSALMRIEEDKRTPPATGRVGKSRPTDAMGILQELIKTHPMVEKLISAHYTADGLAAFIRTKDGNAYEFQIRSAPYAQNFYKKRK